MPKFRVTSVETVYRSGVVEAESREALDEIDVVDMDLCEDDSSEEVTAVEEITPDVV